MILHPQNADDTAEFSFANSEGEGEVLKRVIKHAFLFVLFGSYRKMRTFALCFS